MRNLTKALTVVSLLAPVSGYSLGIGDIRVRSALNQNLNAEIALVASRGEDPSNIKVNLAPAEKFDEAGVPWSYFLSKIRFQPVVKPNGSMVIKVTSREALKEPYLNFLLEVSWPKGSLYREFTVLVDPPAEYQQQGYQAPVYQEPSYTVSPSDENYSSAQRDEYTPRKRVVRQHPVKSRRSPSGSGGFGGQIVTRRNDTLWNVAERARGQGVSIEQMMIALYEKNPSAFYQQNVNALSAGKTLKIPEKGVVQQVSRQEALAEFGRHNDAWKNNRSGITSSETHFPKEEVVDSQLKLEAPAEATVGANETVAPSSGQVESKKSTTTQSASQQQPAADQGNAKGTSVPVDDALQSKVAALEKQMAMMQELIALKDKQLAELQNPAQTATTTPVPPTQPVPSVTAPLEAKPEQPAPPEQATQTSPTPSKPVQPVTPLKPIAKPPIKKAVPVSHPVTEEGSSPLVWILGGLFAILLPLFGWLWWQKKKIMQETDNESMFRNYTNMRSNDSTGAFTTIAKKSGTGSVSAESSFLNDFKASDFESFESFNVDHGDIDPIAEADVYLAYGRYQQAEDLIRQAIKDTPERDECKLKLLEIFHANSNKQDFESYATELAAAGKKDDKEFWKKVSELSKDVCPDSELFINTNTSSPAVFVTESEVLGENVLFDSPAVEEKTVAKMGVDDVEHHGVATFDVSEGAEDAFFNAQSREEPKSEPKGGPSLELVEDEKTIDNTDFDLDTFEDSFTDPSDNGLLDFDLGPYPGNSPDEPEATKVAMNFDSTLDSELDLPSASKEEFEAYDFDFNLDKKETIEPIKKPTAFEAESTQEQSAWEPEKTIDFVVENVTEPEPLSDDTIDFSFDFEPSMTSSSKPTYQDHDFGVSDLTDMDEIETKLDLAKAYIDMGDVDSAKDIIEQVLVKGNEDQKKTAQVLLDDLS